MPAILAACAPDAPAPPSGGTEPTPIDTSNIAGSTIKVGTYGGFFEENFRKMYPAFTEEFDVEVESVSQPTSEVWVVQLQQAIAAGGTPPADVSMLSGVGLQRAINGDILTKYATSDIPTSENLEEGYVRTDDEGNVTGVGGLSWYITLVSNTDRVKESPDSWTAFWDPEWKNELALLRNAANSFLLEITAETLLRRVRHPRDAGRRPRGDAQAAGGQAEREALVPRRGASTTRVQRGRGLARPVLSRHHAVRGLGGGRRRSRSGASSRPRARSSTRDSGPSRRRPRTSARA